MAKKIKLSAEDIENVKSEFYEMISKGIFPDGKISFSKSIGDVKERAKISFSASAWVKMKTLLLGTDKEIGWHGTVCREGNDFNITDIMVYPQEVTGVTVTTDQQKYQEWLYKQDDDTFNSIRFQGHSHVNMGTSPSGVDESLYDRILSQIGKDDYYIFMIINKKLDIYVRIYDLANNVQYDTADIDIKIHDDGTGFYEFLDDIEKNVVDKPTFTKTTYPYGNTSSKTTTTATTKSDKGKTKKKEEENSYYGTYGWYNNYYEDEGVDFKDPFSCWGV